MPWRGLILLLPMVLLSWALAGLLLASLSPSELRGKQIYFEGTSPSGGKIKAYVGYDKIELPGSAATCGSCHGPDGRGRPEAGVIPSDITWDHLMKPYGHSHPMGRKHPVFTEASLKRSILTGFDPAGNRLDASMPTYSMSEDDLNDLIAYLKRLGNDLDPGLEARTIQIGTLMPSRGQAARIGQGMVEVMSAYFADINSRGGIHHRKLKLIATTFEATGSSALADATRLMDQLEVFALVGPVIAGVDREMAALAEDKKVPLIGPFSLYSADPFALNEFTFYLFSGLTEQVRTLVEFAARQLKLETPRIGVLGSGGDQQKDLQTAIAEQSEEHGWTAVTGFNIVPERFKAPAAALMLQEQGVDCLFYLSFGGLKTLLEAADKLNWHPYIFLPGALIEKEILALPAGFQNKVYLSYPTLPSDQTPAGISEFQTLLAQNELTVKHMTSQVSAYVAAKILVEGLKRAGRDLSREKLVRALEKLYAFQTGLTPRVTYGPNRRIGALGAHIVTIDLEKGSFTPMGGWIDLADRR